MWAGERDWQTLVEHLEGKDALVILLVLEILALYTEETSVVANNNALEVATGLLPDPVRQALERNDALAYEEAFQALLPEEQHAAIVTSHYLRARSLGPLLYEIAAVAAGMSPQRSEIEKVLAELETSGFHLMEAVQDFWAGERDAAILTRGLDEQDSIMIQQVLEIVKVFKVTR